MLNILLKKVLKYIKQKLKIFKRILLLSGETKT